MLQRRPRLALGLRVRAQKGFRPHESPLVVPDADGALRLEIAALFVGGGKDGLVFEVRRGDNQGLVGRGLEAELVVPCLF